MESTIQQNSNKDAKKEEVDKEAIKVNNLM